MNNKKPLLILLATGTAGGKGTFISKIKRNQLLVNSKICQIGTDSYVTVRVDSKVGEMMFSTGEWTNQLNTIQKKEFIKNPQIGIKAEHEWCKPESVDIQLLKKKVSEELNDEQQSSQKIIIVEGTHALQFAELREMADLRIWIENDDDLRLIRKIMRSPYYKKMVDESPEDPRNFGGLATPFPNAFKSWVDAIKPGEKEYVLPTKKCADLVVFSNDWTEFSQGVSKIASIIDLYFKNEEEFKKQLTRERKQKIEDEISKLRTQIETKKTELSQLMTEEVTDHLLTTTIQQTPK